MEQLKEIINQNNMDEKTVAEALDMSVAEFWRKYESRELGVKDAERLIEILKIKNPCEIFFKRKIT